jgi:hypothetical protein
VEDFCLQKPHKKTASGISVFLLEELGDARLRCAQLRKYVDEAVNLINKSKYRDHFFEAAAHLIHGVPDTLLRMDKALSAAALAASKLDYEEIKDTLRPEKVEELEQAFKDVRIRRVKKQSEEQVMNIPEAADRLEQLAASIEATGRFNSGVLALIYDLEANAEPATEASISDNLRKLATELLDSEKPRPSRVSLAQSLRSILANSIDVNVPEPLRNLVTAAFGVPKIKNRALGEGVSVDEFVNALKQAADNLWACVGVNSVVDQSFEDALTGFRTNSGPLAGMPEVIVNEVKVISKDLSIYSGMRSLARNLERLATDIKRMAPEAEHNLSLFEEGVGRQDWPHMREKAAEEKEGEKEIEARFEEGKPADPTENMSPEDAKKWKEMTEKHKDKFKSAAKTGEDTAEDIAHDVVSRMSNGMSISDAFKDVGYQALYRSTREADMPDGWEHKPYKERVKALTKAIEKARTRNKSASEEKEGEKEIESRFEEGKPADPTENMSPEDAKKWKEMTEKHKDKFKEASYRIRLSDPDMRAIEDMMSESGISFEEAKKKLEIIKDVAALSSGTLATLTGAREYRILDKIHTGFVIFTKEQIPHRRWRHWQDAWDAYEEQRAARLEEW